MEQLGLYSDKIAEELKKLEAFKEELLIQTQNAQKIPVEDYIEEFLDPEEDVTKNLVFFLGKMKFAKLNGRQVASFGEEYNYVGSPKSNNKEIPPQLQALIEKIESLEQHTGSELNQIVVNKYTGDDAYLPDHSDDEASIKPESDIFKSTSDVEISIN